MKQITKEQIDTVLETLVEEKSVQLPLEFAENAKTLSKAFKETDSKLTDLDIRFVAAVNSAYAASICTMREALYKLLLED